MSHGSTKLQEKRFQTTRSLAALGSTACAKNCSAFISTPPNVLGLCHLASSHTWLWLESGDWHDCESDLCVGAIIRLDALLKSSDLFDFLFSQPVLRVSHT